MSAINNGSSAASVSHTVKREKKGNRFYFNKKSCIAMAVSVALLFTSVDGTVVHAEELADILSPVTEEVNPTVSENTIISEGSPYLTNDEGAVIINSFKVLQKKDSRIELEERKTLEEVLKLMPETLTANVTLVSSVEDETSTDEDEVKPGEEEQPVEDETNPVEGEAPGEGETNPGEGEQPVDGETNPSEGEAPSEGETNPGEGEQPGEGEMNPGEGEQQPGAGDNGDQSGADSGSGDNGGANDDNGDADIGNGDQGGADSGNPDDSHDDAGGSSDIGEDNHSDDSGEAESLSTEDGAIDVAAAGSGSFVQDGQQWRLLVETGESEVDHAGNETNSVDSDAGDHNGGEESRSEEDSTSSTESESAESEEDITSGTANESGGTEDDAGGMGNGTDGIGDMESGSEGDNAGGTENGNSETEDGAGSEIEDGNTGDMTGSDGTDTPIAGEGENTESTVPSVDNVTPKTVEVEVPVTWECGNYDTDESDVYIFVPKWDEKEWFFEESKEHKIPTIKVVYAGPASEVSTEEELIEVFAAGFKKIVLQNDIALTKPLRLPADADIELDGGGYRLIRGNVMVEGEEGESSETFLGIMIEMDGEDYTEDTYGTLTLKDITVDGVTKTDRADAPAILDWGNLILDEGAVVKDNFNYGTYPEEEDGETILDYGGGIQVYGELTVSPDALVTENFADEFGGGVYLAGGATLYLYADVIVDNRVGEGHGYGADLYAAPGSTIYYDPSIDMEREGFYICEGVTLIPLGIMEADLFSPEDADSIEVFVSVNENSGYTPAQIEALKQALRDKGYIVLEGRSEIDATDLRNWYVYDHYDTNVNCWGTYTEGEVPAAWSEFYKESGNKRKYYPYTESLVGYGGNDQVYTIEEWLDVIANPTDARHGRYTWQSKYTGVNGEDVIVGGLRLARFKAHISSTPQDGGAMMTFAGYGITPNIDFLYYDPKSDGEKVVDFDVDSSQIDIHTLRGNGFLVNTGVEGDKLYGYLILYAYGNIYTTVVDSYYDTDGNPVQGSVATGVTGSNVRLYRLDGVPVDDFHNGTYGLGNTLTPQIASKTIQNWDDMMSVQIIATPNKIEVRQQPKSNTEDIRNSEAILTYEIQDASQGENGNHYSGFGPLVAYGSHSCSSATTFTYSNLRMYFTNPMLEQADILSPLEKADFTQKKTQKYFINLLGDAKDEEGEKIGYADSANFGQYQEYMEMMQHEGIALITDRKTPFGSYLGEANEPDSNLFELEREGLLSPQELADWIADSIKEKHYTDLEGKGLAIPNPVQSVGNIWLESAAGGDQIRELDGSSIGRRGYEIQIRDDLTYYFGDKAGIEVTYEVFKPGESDPIWRGTSSPDNPLKFTITANALDWPSGQYTVQQTVSNSSICGYSYFNLKQPDEPPVYPPVYQVKVKVEVIKDDEEWKNHGKTFMLRSIDGGDLRDLSEAVPEGNYFVYDVTDLEEGASPTEAMNTNVLVKVEDADVPGVEIIEELYYYTVTFYDGEDFSDKDTPLAQQTVLKGRTIPEPEKPEPSDAFAGWMTRTQDEGNKTYDFSTPINQKTNIFASWIFPVEVKVTVNLDGKPWDSHDKKFKLQSEDGGAVTDFSAVPAGDYDIYDVTGLDLAEGVYTGVSITVPSANRSGTTVTPNKDEPVNYYTVAFYDGEDYSDDGTSEQLAKQIVLSGQSASDPEVRPSRPPYVFAGWVTEAGGRDPYQFSTPVGNKTNVYASWTYPVSVIVTVKIDNDEPKEPYGRHFALWSGVEGDEPVREPFLVVPAGKYTVYDVTGLEEGAALTEDRNTGQSVEVKIADIKNTWEDAEVNYYSVKFYDENSTDKKLCESGTEQNPQIILKDQRTARPEFVPTKDKYAFTGWVTADGTEFNFDSKINTPTEIYASWEKIEEPRYKVTVNSGKDGGEWKDSGRIFALRLQEAAEDDEEVEETVFDLAQVKKGTYRVYDITGGSRFRAASTAMDVKVDDGDTGVTVTVENKDETATVDYYTVTFYDGMKAYGTDDLQSPTIVLHGKKVTEPSAPGKKGYRFTGWMIENRGSTAFDFDQAINSKTDIYAGWRAVRSETDARKPEEDNTSYDGGGAEDTQTITVLQETSPQAITPTSDKASSGDKEPKTGEIPQIEIYATMTMISGLMYLLLYFADEGHGMTEREKEEFVAALIRWAKKGGKFRRYCALVAIFFILVYYHSIGKRLTREINRECLQLLRFGARSEHQEVRQQDRF